MEIYFDHLTEKNVRLDKLADEMETLAQNAEELVEAGGSALPPKEKQKLESILAQIKSTAGRVKEQAVTGIKATDRVIRSHPYESAGIALAAGVVVGVLVGRTCWGCCED